MNALFLIAVAFLPFCFKTVIYWPTQYYSSLLVFLTLTVMAASLLTMWCYATKHRRFSLDESEVPNDVINVITLNLVVLLVIHVLGMVLATTTSLVSLLVLLLIPLLMIFASFKIDLILYAYIAGKKLVTKWRATSAKNDPMNQIELQPSQGVYKAYENEQKALTEEERITLFFNSKHFRRIMLDRLAFFSDAMFAIIITVLVVELKPPIPSSYLHMSTVTASDGSYTDSAQIPIGYVDISPATGTYSWSPFYLNKMLGDALGSHWAQYVSFITTAVVVTSLWKHHMLALQGLKNANRFFCLWNITFLGTLSLIPFSTYIISQWYSLNGSAVPNSIVLVVSCKLLLHYTNDFKLSYSLLYSSWHIIPISPRNVMMINGNGKCSNYYAYL
jgi:uncharacterized membrane protein